MSGLTESIHPPVTVEIADVFPETVKVPVSEIKVGDYVFDGFGRRYRLSYAGKVRKDRLRLFKREGERYGFYWDADDTATIVRREA